MHGHLILMFAVLNSVLRQYMLDLLIGKIHAWMQDMFKMLIEFRVGAKQQLYDLKMVKQFSFTCF